VVLLLSTGELLWTIHSTGVSLKSFGPLTAAVALCWKEVAVATKPQLIKGNLMKASGTSNSATTVTQPTNQQRKEITVRKTKRSIDKQEQLSAQPLPETQEIAAGNCEPTYPDNERIQDIARDAAGDIMRRHKLILLAALKQAAGMTMEQMNALCAETLYEMEVEKYLIEQLAWESMHFLREHAACPPAFRKNWSI
jgi:hypothetical protein